MARGREKLTYRNIVVLTGAGISAESGLGTFRDKDGIWTKYPLEDLATPEGFARNPDFVHKFYNDRRTQSASASPNTGHIALADLERSQTEAGHKFLLVTQNVDNLHEKAGSNPANIIHMHGELDKSRCGACGDIMACDTDLSTKLTCKICNATGQTRPDVVWFAKCRWRWSGSRRSLRTVICLSRSVHPAMCTLPPDMRGSQNLSARGQSN